MKKPNFRGFSELRARFEDNQSLQDFLDDVASRLGPEPRGKGRRQYWQRCHAILDGVSQ